MAGNYLPKDVLLEVLARLPVKSLSRFKCVSKSWRDILKEPTFIIKHYQTRASSNHDNTLLCRRSTLGNFEFSLLSEDAEGIKFTDLNLPFFEKEVYENKALEVAGPCNGIVLISDRYADSYLWNPATRAFKALPSSSYPSLLPGNFYLGCSLVGFGIDPITNNYKVVRISSFYQNVLAIDANTHMDKVEVLSLSATSCKPCDGTWKTIDTDLPVDFFYTNLQYNVYLKGKCYWCCESFRSRGSVAIVWFDFGAEVFGFEELPDIRADFTDLFHSCRLMPTGESIAMVRYTHRVDADKFFYKMWIMDECETRLSWKEYATIGPLRGDDDEPLGVWKGEELIVKNYHGNLYVMHLPSDRLLSYSIRTDETKDPSEKIYLDGRLPLATYYESLVSVLGED